MKRWEWLAVAFALAALPLRAEILFQDDFEGGQIDAKKWNPKPDWKIVAPQNAPAALGGGVLDFNAGEANISLRNDFKDFILEADFQAMEGGLTGFVFRAQDAANNFYMHQISTGKSAHTPQHVRWHTRLAGAWIVDPKPFENGEIADANKWYRARWTLKGSAFEVSIVESDAYYKNPAGAKFRKLGAWDNKQFDSGAIGFRASGGEHMQYDNLLVYSIGFNPLAVDPSGKAASTWGALKK